MGPMQPRDVLLAFHDAFVRKDVEALCALYADDAVNLQAPDPPLRGKEAIRASFIGFFAAFPDETTTVVNVYADGEWAMWEWTGGNDKMRPAGDTTEVSGCGFFHVVDGKIVLQRGYWDKLSFLKAHGLPLTD